MHTVLICGDRNWDNFSLLLKTLSEVQQAEGVALVVQGEATGADTMGRQAAALLGIPERGFPADWRKHGRSAGPIRNVQMLKEGKPTLVLAFHPFIENSKGTKHMVEIAQKAGVPVKIITGRENGKEIQPPSQHRSFR